MIGLSIIIGEDIWERGRGLGLGGGSKQKLNAVGGPGGGRRGQTECGREGGKRGSDAE